MMNESKSGVQASFRGSTTLFAKHALAPQNGAIVREGKQQMKREERKTSEASTQQVKDANEDSGNDKHKDKDNHTKNDNHNGNHNHNHNENARGQYDDIMQTFCDSSLNEMICMIMKREQAEAIRLIMVEMGAKKHTLALENEKTHDRETEPWQRRERRPMTQEEYMKTQWEMLSEDERRVARERDGLSARTQVYDYLQAKKRVVAASIVRPREEVVPASSRANRQARRSFRKGMSLINTKSQVLTLSMLQQRRKRVYFRKSAIHGYGLYAQEDIESGEFVIEYVGTVIRRSIADVREKEYQREGVGDSYMFRINTEMVIDATRRGGISRFINHSCDPNLTAKVISIGGENHIVFYSKKDIRKHAELTYDYKFDLEGDDQKIRCLCRSPNCRIFLN